MAAFGAGFLSWNESIASAIFIGIVPLSWWILAMWMGEVVRMLRSVEFCTEQERLINDATPSGDRYPTLRWEQWRQEQGARTITWTYASVGLLLAFANAAAMTCATITAVHTHWALWVLTAVWILVAAGGGLLALWVRETVRTWGGADVGLPPMRLLRILRSTPGPREP